MVFLPPCCRCVRTPSMSPKCAHTHTHQKIPCVTVRWIQTVGLSLGLFLLLFVCCSYKLGCLLFNIYFALDLEEETVFGLSENSACRTATIRETFSATTKPPGAPKRLYPGSCLSITFTLVPSIRSRATIFKVKEIIMVKDVQTI